ncbi:hypothetical protein [Sphaerisporangium aureirubrum]|uniref:SRPBCC family protein n=1 Tax=Sphaerisporangium aureirubrum TaxID=1544736 RepID=A0ABW1NUX4_9ACTN
MQKKTPEPPAGDPGPRGRWSGFFGRTVEARTGVIAAVTGVLALVVAILAWWAPLPWSGGADVPEGFLGTWRGQVAMKIDDPLGAKGGSAGVDEITIRQAAVGEVAADQRAVEWVDGVGCSRSWELTEAAEDRIELKARTTTVPEGLPPGMTCLTDLTMTVRLAGQDTIGITAGYHSLGTLLTAFSGTLTRQG